MRSILSLHMNTKEYWVYSKIFRFEKMQIDRGQCKGGGGLFDLTVIQRLLRIASLATRPVN